MSEAMSDKLSALKETYVERLQREFDAHYSAVKKPINHTTAVRLKEYLHKLAGSGGSFGFANLSALSKATELFLMRIIENSSGISSANEYLNTQQRQELHKRFDDIREEVRLASTSVYLTAAARSEKVAERYTKFEPAVWLLDDDKLAIDELARQLSSFGFDITVFYDFNSFNQALNNSSPAFLIADIVLDKGETFFELCAQHGVRLTRSELVIMSSHDSFSARLEAVRHNATYFLRKPADSHRLAKFLRERETEVTPERVLLVDDDEDLAQFYKLHLESIGMIVKTLNHPQSILECVSEFQPDIIVIDLYMPEVEGSEVAAVLRQYDEFDVVPVIYLSSETGNPKITQALEKGGDDFLTKPIDEYTLKTAIQTRVRRARQLHKLIQLDSMTGLLKHSAIKDAVGKALSRNHRRRASLVVAMLDLDLFKKVNDTYGHAVGDKVIVGLSTVLYRRLRRTDEIGRYGGEEFLIVLPDCDAPSAQEILNDIRIHFKNIKFTSGSETFSCSLSAGFTVVDRASGLDVSLEALIARADQALYVAKTNGRDRVERYQDS